MGQLSYVADGTVARLHFDNPGKHNAMSLAMWRALSQRVAEAQADPAVRVLVLAGAGETAFVSGSDISSFGAERTSPEAVRLYNEAVEAGLAALHGFAKPSVALIQGYCIGGGLSIAAAADLRFASAEASFAIPAGRLGIGYSFGQIARLQALAGQAVVRDLVFTARRMGAAEALRCGLLNEVSEDAAGLEAMARDRVGAIAANAPLTLRAAKLASAQASAIEPDVAAVEAAIATCFASDDYREGQAAFAEKRRPLFQGR